MPYFAKSVFLTVSYFILMNGIADLKMFFVSLLIFVGGILFDLYFSYTALEDFGENWAVTVTKIIICMLAAVAVFGLIVSVLGLCNVLVVTKNEGMKYIIFKNKELKNMLSGYQVFECKFDNFLKILFIEVASCMPDYLIHKLDKKEKLKYKQKKQEVVQ